MISVMKRCVPRSMPLAQAIDRHALAICGASASRRVRRSCAGTRAAPRRPAHVRDRAGRGDALVEPDAGQARASRASP
jgi:hypothetical protein